MNKDTSPYNKRSAPLPEVHFVSLDVVVPFELPSGNKAKKLKTTCAPKASEIALIIDTNEVRLAKQMKAWLDIKNEHKGAEDFQPT